MNMKIYNNTGSKHDWTQRNMKIYNNMGRKHGWTQKIELQRIK